MSDITEQVDLMLRKEKPEPVEEAMIDVNTSVKDLLSVLNDCDNKISAAGDILLFNAEASRLSKREAKLFESLMTSIEKEAKDLSARMKKVMRDL